MKEAALKFSHAQPKTIDGLTSILGIYGVTAALTGAAALPIYLAKAGYEYLTSPRPEETPAEHPVEHPPEEHPPAHH